MLDTFFEVLNSKDWIKGYIFWELEFFKLLGYDLELKNIVKKEIINKKVNYYAKSSNERKNVPNFLIDESIEVEDINVLLKGLKLVSDFLDKTILKPNNISYPTSRTNFVNLLK